MIIKVTGHSFIITHHYLLTLSRVGGGVVTGNRGVKKRSHFRFRGAGLHWLQMPWQETLTITFRIHIVYIVRVIYSKREF